MELDFDTCRRAATSRDARFDGLFVTAVKSTRIYCRPSCPAIVAEARRTCGSCRPRPRRSARASGPACAAGRTRRPARRTGTSAADVVGRAMRLIADGVVDRDGVPGLAGRLGYTERHLHRMLTAEVGAGPLALARAQRAQTARVLIETTGLGLAEIAFAAGFGSVRQFNDTVREIYGRTPSELRARARGRDGTRGGLSVRLPFRAPLHAEALLAFLGDRAIAGLDEVATATYQRNLRLPHGTGTVACAPATATSRPRCAWPTCATWPRRWPAAGACFDLDADPAAVDAVLGADPPLAPLVSKEPGVRVPRAVDGFEIAVRAIVGQQISVAGAPGTVARKLVARPISGAVPDPGRTARAAGRRRSRCRPRGGARCGRWRTPIADGELDLDGGGDREATPPGSTRSPASATGPPSTRRCARSATPTRSCPPTSASGAAPGARPARRPQVAGRVRRALAAVAVLRRHPTLEE